MNACNICRGLELVKTIQRCDHPFSLDPADRYVVTLYDSDRDWHLCDECFKELAKGFRDVYERLLGRGKAPVDLDDEIDWLVLPGRVRKRLIREGICTIGGLSRVTELELISQKNFGQVSLDEVKRFLAAKGLTLAEDPLPEVDLGIHGCPDPNSPSPH